MSSRVPHETRRNVVKMWARGLAQRKIVTAVWTTHSTVNRIIQAFRDERRICDKARNYRRKTTEDEDFAMISAAFADPFITAGKIRDSDGIHVCDEVVRQRLREAGLRSRTAAQKPLLSAAAKAKRLAFAQSHADWSAEDWQNVVFTDESTVCTE
ncbi:hypothetical protein HPB48_011465 [Haemaphysalis longicornis]|uniref:Transposase Tc1-like domain-containing protein n=1 Tax=Haemaphysalis longicornis TaxID=44386 RepID=A0A9J6FAY9_HAELO|nr:hypothetical protein HPB48_011465 [Haemaphysalis longicornis]